MNFRFHTKAIIYNQEGKILVQQRSDTLKRDLIGGKTEIPEKIEDAIIREIKEETGISDIQKLQVISIESLYTPQEDKYFVLVIFKCYTSLQSKISNEHLDHMRIDKKDILSIGLSDYLQESLQKIQDLF